MELKEFRAEFSHRAKHFELLWNKFESKANFTASKKCELCVQLKNKNTLSTWEFKEMSNSPGNLGVVENKIAIKGFFLENVYEVSLSKNT